MRIFAQLLVLLPLLWVEGVWAVVCSSDYLLETQNDVNALGASGCHEIRGDLDIYSEGVSDADAITDLSPLSDLTYISGHFGVGPVPSLQSLEGLHNLIEVGGVFSIGGNAALVNLDGLRSLSRIGAGDTCCANWVQITGNSELRDINGLASLSDISDSTLTIENNPKLINLDGLIGLSTLRGRVVIQNNESLADLNGLSNLVSVQSEFRVTDNPALTDLNGLAGVRGFGWSLVIGNNQSLNNVDGLIGVESVGWSLEIWGNTALTNLHGLANIASIRNDLSISSNDSLTSLAGLASLTSVGGSLYIYNTSFTSLDGPTNLTSLGGQLQIGGNASLSNLDGLANLTTVGSILRVNNNAILKSLEGLKNVTSVASNLFITSNPLLPDLDGLGNIRSIDGSLIVENNNALANCQGLAPVLGWPDGNYADFIGDGVYISRNVNGCNSIEQLLASVSGPTKAVITSVASSGTNLDLDFIASTTSDTPFPITGYSASCTGSEVDVSGSPATDLLDNTPITETLTVSGYDPTSVLSSIEVDIDIAHSDPTDLYITLTTPEGTELILWNQGSSGGENLVGTFPSTLTAVDSLDSVTRQTMDGDWVLSIEDIDVGPLVREGVLNSWGIRITEELARNGSSSPIEVFGATRGRDYTCTVAPVTKLGTTPVSDPYTVSVPLELPATPTITSTDYEDGKIILTVSVTDNGGTDITGYDATCTDGTNTFTGTSTSSPITVSGLTNDVAYTCTVTATNSVGTSSVSAATDPITPEETATGLPIWLLYQATQ